MKLLAAAVLLAMTGAAYAEVNCDPGTAGSLSPQCNKQHVKRPVNNNTATAVGVGVGGAGGAGGSASSTNTLYGGSSNATAVAQPVANASATYQGGEIINAPQVNVAAGGSNQGSAFAPDVISYPTAPCRVAVGASGGWLGGAFGVTGSVLDENCQRIETSRHLYNIGQQAAATQILCLNPEARQAMEVTGVKCLISGPAAPEPRVTP